MVSAGLLSALQVPRSSARLSPSSDNCHQLPADGPCLWWAPAVFLSLVKAPSHPLQPAVRQYFVDRPLTSLSCWKPGSVTQTLFLFFSFWASHLLSVSSFPVPPRIPHYLFPFTLCVFIPIPCLLKPSLQAQMLVWGLKWRMWRLVTAEAGLQCAHAHS